MSNNHSISNNKSSVKSNDVTLPGTLWELVARGAPVTKHISERVPGDASTTTKTTTTSTTTFALIIAYDGSFFHGSAADPQQGNTVQAHLQAKLANMLGVKVDDDDDDDVPPKVVLHGRTDAGVHSAGTVGHVQLQGRAVQCLAERCRHHRRRRRRCNNVEELSQNDDDDDDDLAHAAADVLQRTLVRGLGSGHVQHIQVRRVLPVAPIFHARKSSVSKVYTYRVHEGYPLPWMARTCWVLHGKRLNVDAMQSVANKVIVGIHDCTVFCRNQRQRIDFRSPIRHIMHIDIARQEQNLDNFISTDDDNNDLGVVTFTIQADFFLTHMCRRIVGLLVQVGLGKVTPQIVADVLGTGFAVPTCSAMQSLLLRTAPPQGLCLQNVMYSPNGIGKDPTRPASTLPTF